VANHSTVRRTARIPRQCSTALWRIGAAAGLWNRFTVHTTFLTAVEEQLHFTHSPPSLLSARGGLDLPLLLALCGWEIRPAIAVLESPAAASSAIADSSGSTAASASSVVLQCCFGCREVGALNRFCAALPSALVAADADDGNHAAIQGTAAHEFKEEAEEEEEEEERSMFQSPLKRRKLRADDSTGLATATAASASSVVAAALSAAAAASSAPVTPAEPQSLPVVRASPHGFHASLEHRPFCPFVLPLVDEADLAPSTTAAGSSAASARDERKQAMDTTDDDEDLPLGWQQVLRWWLQREREKRLVAAQLDEQAAAAAAVLPSGEPVDAVAAAASSSAGAASSSASSSSSSSLLHKEARCRQAIGTVRKLLSNIAQLPAMHARSTLSDSGSS
jgi:hypothetical protein